MQLLTVEGFEDNQRMSDGPVSDASKLAANLVALRSAAGMTQSELAIRADVTRQHVAALEVGKASSGGPANPRLTTLSKLADALNVSVADLLIGVPDRSD